MNRMSARFTHAVVVGKYQAHGIRPVLEEIAQFLIGQGLEVSFERDTAQATGAKAKSFQIPSNVEAPIPPNTPKLEDVKLIDYDFAKYGSASERKRILERWDKEVAALPK